MRNILPFTPIVTNNTETSRRSNLQYIICWIALIIITLFLGTRMVLFPTYRSHDCTEIIVIDAILIICLFINHKGYSVASAYIATTFVWLAMTLIAFRSGEINSCVMISYLPLIVISGLFLGRVWGVVVTIVCIVTTLVLTWLQQHGMIPQSHLSQAPGPMWIGFSISAVMIGIVQYISDHQINHAFKQVKLQEERYLSLLEHASDPIILLNEDTSFNDINSSTTKVLGYSRDEFLHMKLADIFSPGELAKIPLQTEHLKLHKTLLIERKFRTKYGTDLDMEVHTRVLDGIGYLLIARDITERKLTEEKLRQSEMKYRRIFENVLDVFFQTSVEGIILEISPSIENHLGYRREDLIGAKIIDFYYDPNDREKVLKLLKEHGEIKDHEMRFRASNGELVYVSVSAKIFPGTDGMPTHIDGVFNNITQRVKYLNGIEEQNKKLRDIAWVQSHVVRAPLARMMGLVEIFKDLDMTSAEFKELIAHFHTTAAELDTIIHDISVKAKDMRIE